MRPGACYHGHGDAGQWRDKGMGMGMTGTISSQLHEGDERLRKECITAPMADEREAGEGEMRFGLAELRRDFFYKRRNRRAASDPQHLRLADASIL